MSQVLPPGGPRDRGRSHGLARATIGEHITLAIALVLGVAFVAAVWIVPGTYFADTVMSIVLSPFIFIGGLWAGTLAGWAKAGWLFPDLAFRLSFATASGIVSGLLIAWLQRGLEERRESLRRWLRVGGDVKHQFFDLIQRQNRRRIAPHGL